MSRAVKKLDTNPNQC